MTRFKIGFTLSEVLIVLSIIGVVSAYGFNATKSNLEKAYNYYYYTSYKSISDAFASAQNAIEYDAAGNEINIFEDFLTINGNAAINNSNFYRYVRNMLSVPDNQAPDGQGFYEARNHVKFRLDRVGDGVYRIAVNVPGTKKNTGHNRYDIYYIPDRPELGNNTFFIPGPQRANDNAYSRTPNLQARKDLIAFYSDDGMVGRIIENENGSKSYQKIRQVFSAQELFCATYPDARILRDQARNLPIFSCNGIGVDPQLSGQIPRAINPKRFF